MMIDPTAADPREKAAIYPERFWVRYVPDEKDPTKTTPVEMVLWAKKGQHIMTGQKTPMRVSQAKKDLMVWAALEPFYNDWKKGAETPINGTPLPAWPGVTPEQVERLKMLQVRSVEDVAAMTDADLERYGMGGLALRQQARAFTEAKKDRSVIQGEMVSRDKEIARLKAEGEERDAQMRELMARVEQLSANQPRKPGRPRKEAADEAA